MIRSPKHIKFIRGLPCTITNGYDNCNQTPVDTHHLTIIKGEGGMRLKAGDDKTVPLCRFHHTTLHSMGEKAFWKEYKINAVELAKELWCGQQNTAL